MTSYPLTKCIPYVT